MTSSAPDSIERTLAVLVTPGIDAAAPPGVDPAAFAGALAEDCCDLAASLDFVVPLVAVSHGAQERLGGLSVDDLAWPGTEVLRLRPAGPGDAPAPGARGTGWPDGPVVQTFEGMAAHGGGGGQVPPPRQGGVIAADAPDLPLLLVGKLFRGLGGATRRADVTVCPAEGGGLVAIAAWLPLADWARSAFADPAPPHAAGPSGTAAELDRHDAVERLRRAAPRRSALQLVPGWHRLRSPSDLGHLDPGLEGWAATRSLLRQNR